MHHLDLAWPLSDITRRSSGTSSVVVFRNRVYRVGHYLTIVDRQPGSDFLPTAVTAQLRENQGGDIGDSFSGVPADDQAMLMLCMDRLFFEGVVQQGGFTLSTISSSFRAAVSTERDTCATLNPLLFVLFMPIALVLLIRSVKAFGFPQFAARTPVLIPTKGANMPPHVLIFIPVYAESEYILRKTLESALQANSPSDRRVLVVVCDGQVRSHGSSHELNYEIVLRLLGHESSAPPQPHAYTAHSGSTNTAQLYSGVAANNTPFIVVAKMGTLDEHSHIGNRGKRDSHALLLKFLYKLMGDAPMTRFEYELYQHFTMRLGIEPRDFLYALTLDADTSMSVDTLPRLMHAMQLDSYLCVAQANTLIANGFSSVWTALQAFPLFLSHNLDQQWTATSTNGHCTLYRLKFANGVPCVLAPGLVRQYCSSDAQIDNAHLTNEWMISTLSEDRALFLLGRRSRPDFKVTTQSSAACFTHVPTGFSTMVATTIRRMITDFAVYRENMRVGSTIAKIAAFMSMAWMVLQPSFAVGLYYLAIAFMTQGFVTWSYAFVVAPFVLIPLLQMVGQLAQFRFGFLVYTPLYMLVGVPLFVILLPMMALASRSKSVQWADSIPAADDHGRALRAPPRKRTDVLVSPANSIPEYRLGEWIAGKVEPISDSMLQSGMLPAVSNKQQLNMTGTSFAPMRAPLPPLKQPIIALDARQSVRPFSVASVSIETDTGNEQWARGNSVYTNIPAALSQQAVSYPTYARPDAGPRVSTAGRSTAISMITDMTLGDEEIVELAGGLTKDEIRDEIQFHLRDVDLNVVTRRKVKEHLFSTFGEAVGYYDEFINEAIEEYTLSRLAI